MAAVQLYRCSRRQPLLRHRSWVLSRVRLPRLSGSPLGAGVNESLRTALVAVTLDPDVAKHPREIEKLRCVHRHSIRVVDAGERDLASFNCFVFALELPTLSSIGGDWLSVVNTHYIERLISTGNLQPDPDGEIAVYFTPRPSHAGRRVGDRIVSKWGTGHVYDHPPLEVPLSYGSDFRYFRRAPLDDLLAEFRLHYAGPKRYFWG